MERLSPSHWAEPDMVAPEEEEVRTDLAVLAWAPCLDEGRWSYDREYVQMDPVPGAGATFPQNARFARVIVSSFDRTRDKWLPTVTASPTAAEGPDSYRLLHLVPGQKVPWHKNNVSEEFLVASGGVTVRAYSSREHGPEGEWGENSYPPRCFKLCAGDLSHFERDEYRSLVAGPEGAVLRTS